MPNFAIFAPDCDCYYYDEAPKELFCPYCDSFIGKSPYYPDHLEVKNLKLNFSFTYDGRLLLSKNAKDFLKSESKSKLFFHRVNFEPEIYIVETKGTISFDSNKRKTRFVNPCAHCGSFESIVGATPIFIKNKAEIGSFSFVKTDLEFGSGREKSPLYIVSGKLGEKLKIAFREIDLEMVRLN